ncbi:MAG: hypothetical protein PF485_09685 [Bacteroidales bacterium]|jgi:hypothetical protein|nr:hypothetical protein [Bacteroidales bacterium]
MNNIYRILNLFVLLFFGSFVHGQQSNITNNRGVIEHIKLNTDRDLYFNGENIFFTADYFIDNEKTNPILSKTLYLELIESISNIPIIQKKYKIADFKVNDQIHIPIDVASGSYLLRAYTQYQRNFSALNFSSCFITILNPNSSLQQKAVSGDTDSIYIVAEGNILLDNIKNNIVIKLPKSIITSNNRYIITDETDTIIKELNPHISGFIQTEMRLLKAKQYKLAIIKSEGDSIIKDFPIMQSTGIQTSTQFVGNNIHYKIQTKGIDRKNKNLDFQIKIFSKDFIIKYQEDVSVDESFFDYIIPANVLDNGINYIVLTDKDGIIKKVNSLFKSRAKSNSINIVINKDNFKPNEKIEAFISTKNEIGKSPPLVSVSITRIGTKKEDHGFLTAFYMNNPIALENYLNSSMQIDKDLQHQIMILFDKTINTELFIERSDNTQRKDLEYIPEIRDLTISGILRNKNTKEPIPNHDIYLSVLFNNPQIHVNKTRENGEFIFSINNVNGKNDVFLCSESYSEEENTHEILVKSSFSSDYTPISPTIFIDNDDAELIQELYINAKINQKFNKNQDNNLTKKGEFSSFNINDNKTTIIPDDYIDLETMQELFNEIIPGISVKKNKNKFVFKVLDENSIFLIGNPLILLDHIPIFNENSIMELDPSQIEKVEVIYEPYIFGSHTFTGVIMLTTNIDNFADVELPKSATFMEYRALEVPTINFHINKNSSDSLTKIPDFRTTLYWNPQIKLTNEEQVINFSASDRKGSYNIIINGYNSDGQAFYGKKQITIE